MKLKEHIEKFDESMEESSGESLKSFAAPQINRYYTSNK